MKYVLRSPYSVVDSTVSRTARIPDCYPVRSIMSEVELIALSAPAMHNGPLSLWYPAT